jgi:hypothetical protein
MLRESVLVDREDTCWIKREVVRLIEGNTLWCSIDINALHRTVTLHDALTTCVIGVAACLAVTKYRHVVFSLSVYLFFILALDTID